MSKLRAFVETRLGDHAHHVRGKKPLQILGSALLAFGVLGLVCVWAAATAGYETTSQFSENWNLTDTGHWYSKFIPGRTENLCQPALIGTGSQFYTTNGVFLWEMGKQFNVTGTVMGESDKTINFNGTNQGYSDNKLEHCDVSGFAIDLDLLQANVRVQTYVTCIDPSWPALIRTDNVYSIDQNRLVDESLWYNSVIVPDIEGDSITTSINDVAGDMWRRLKAIYLRSEDLMPTIRGFRVTNNHNCALVPQNRSSCFEEPLSWTGDQKGFFMYPNLTVADTEYSPIDWNVSTSNLINVLFAAARYDLGSPMNNNIFVNGTAKTAAIIVNDNAGLDNTTGFMNTLDGASTFLATPDYPPPKIGRARATYMCLVAKIKPVAAFAIAVIGLSLSLFGAVFAMVMFGVDKAKEARSGKRVRQQEMEETVVDAIEENNDENGDPDTSRDYEPSNLYGSTIRNSDMMYTPIKSYQNLNDAGSGTVTPSPFAEKRMGSLSSLSKLMSEKSGIDLTSLGQRSGATTPAPGGGGGLGTAGGVAAGGVAGGLAGLLMGSRKNSSRQASGNSTTSLGGEGKSALFGNVPGVGNIPGAGGLTGLAGGAIPGGLPNSINGLPNLGSLTPANLASSNILGKGNMNMPGMANANLANNFGNVSSPHNLNAQGNTISDMRNFAPAGAVALGSAGAVALGMRTLTPTGSAAPPASDTVDATRTMPDGTTVDNVAMSSMGGFGQLIGATRTSEERQRSLELKRPKPISIPSHNRMTPSMSTAAGAPLSSPTSAGPPLGFLTGGASSFGSVPARGPGDFISRPTSPGAPISRPTSPGAPVGFARSEQTTNASTYPNIINASSYRNLDGAVAAASAAPTDVNVPAAPVAVKDAAAAPPAVASAVPSGAGAVPSTHTQPAAAPSTPAEGFIQPRAGSTTVSLPAGAGVGEISPSAAVSVPIIAGQPAGSLPSAGVMQVPASGTAAAAHAGIGSSLANNMPTSMSDIIRQRANDGAAYIDGQAQSAVSKQVIGDFSAKDQLDHFNV